MKIPVTNDTAMPIYVGAAMIPPGETRHFEEDDVPHHLRPQVAEIKTEDTPLDPLAELLKGTVPSVVLALPDMSIADIERLGDLEQQGQGRKGILSAIAEIMLAKAGAD